MTTPWPAWPPEPATLHLRVASGAAGAAEACLAAAAHLQGAALSARALYRVELVLEELLMNVALHARCAQADVRVAVTGDAVLLGVEDDGDAFDPTHLAPAAAPPSLEGSQVGGLGLSLVRQSVRDWRYERVAGRNRVTALLARS